MSIRLRPAAGAIALVALLAASPGFGAIPAAHVYHNHMPNFWPFYAVDVGARYDATAVGQPVRYFYDAQVINLKNSPPTNYPYYLPASAGGGIMPHDDLVSYYSHHAKTGAYLSWPMQAARELHTFSAGKGQVHVTMSGAVVNNVNDLNTLRNVPGYDNPAWGAPWRTAYQELPTGNGHRTLDMMHMTGHHSMCPLVGNEFCLKDLIYQNVTLAQPYFLDGSFRSSNGYFPTELGFSKRTIPVLAKLGIDWAVIGNNHFSRTLKDYPFERYYPNLDTMVSPPNRADLRNSSSVGSWVDQPMAHEQQVIRNKLPFANTPHWVRHVDPASGAVSKVAGIPVDQAGSWLEGWEGSTTVDALTPFASLEPRQFFVVAHDGDNSQGRSGSLDTWQNGYNVTCTGGGYCLGIDEYLQRFPIPASDVQHVQDGSWIDTRDSSSDPQWHHWRLPFGIWRGQFADMNRVNGTQLAPKRNLDGIEEGMTVSFEYGFHYLERNFALLQAALNYARTAEQIWLDSHPNWWSPRTALDRQLTHAGNQLNPHMLSFPVKGDAANDYAGGANPAELAWYFLLPAMDSGFGYYDENKDDHVKGTLAFNNSLHFSRPYVSSRLSSDRTGPSLWWPQRWPYNPGSVNADKSQGWTVQHYNNVFAVYTYAHDVSGIRELTVRIRPHRSRTLDEADDTYKVYDPAALAGRPGLNITPDKVGAWRSFPMLRRALRPVMNGVAWNKVNMDTMAVLPAQETGDLYYSYISAYRDQLLDYYIEATDARGNVTRSDIQQVYVGSGRYNRVENRWIEAADGATEGSHPFLSSADSTPPSVPGQPAVSATTASSISLRWAASSDNVAVTAYDIYRNDVVVNSSSTASFTDSGLQPATSYRYRITARDAAGNSSARSAQTTASTLSGGDSQPPTAPGAPRATQLAATSVTLAWTAATDNVGVHHYEVYRDGDPIARSSSAGHVDASVQPARSYRYHVIAFDAAGNASPASPSTVIRTPALPDTVPPSRPGAPRSTTVTPRSVALVWTASTDNVGVQHYEVFRDGVRIARSPGTAHTDSSVLPEHSYRYHVVAFDAAGNASAASPSTVVRTPSGRDNVAPTRPGTPRATAVAATSVMLAWAASSDNVAVEHYDIFRDGDRIAQSPSASFADLTVQPDRSYRYHITAVDAAGNVSPASPSVVVRTPAGRDMQPPSVPRELQAVARAMTSIELRWTAATDNVGVTGYAIWRGSEQVGSTTAATRFTDRGLQPGTAYSYRVMAHDAAGNSSAAAGPLPVSTLPDSVAPGAPSQLAASAIGSSSFTLSWQAARDNVAVTAYEVRIGSRITGVGAVTSTPVSGLSPATTYAVDVRALDAAGNRSPWSTALAVRTLADSGRVRVEASVTATTVWGQNLYLVGNRKELSDWNPYGGIPCTTTAASYPRWTCAAFELPASSRVEYKLIKRDDKGAVIWEGNQGPTMINRVLDTPASGTVGLELGWK